MSSQSNDEEIRNINVEGAAASCGSSGAPKGLPGFLRRTLRISLDEEVVGNTSNITNETIKSTSEDNESSVIAQQDQQKQKEQQRKARSSSETSTSLRSNSNFVNKSELERSASARISSKDKKQSSNRSSGNSNIPKKSYKVITFEKCITAPIVNVRDLRKLSWNGIPPKYRSESWKILLGYLPANASRRSTTLQRKRLEYRDAIAQHYDNDDSTRTLTEQETLRQVLVDVPRTAPDVGLFRHPRIRSCLQRLLFIWAMRHPASSYVQGINDLATPLIAVFLSQYYDGKDMTGASTSDADADALSNILDTINDTILDEIEADSYWCLTKLLAGIQDHYTSDQPGVQRMVLRLKELVHRIDIDLCNHLSEIGIEFMQFAFKWMNCLLVREFKIQVVIRLWDTYLSEDDNSGFENFHVYVCAAFLCQYSSDLQSMEFDELFGFLQNMPTSDWGDTEVEVLLSQAYVLCTLFGGSDAHLGGSRPA